MATVESRPFLPPIVAGVAWATIAQSLDAKMLPAVLPLMRGSYSLSIDEGNWVAISYLMASFAILPLSPWLVERFGRRRTYLSCVAGFVFGAAACASAIDFPMLVAARVVQGAFGAGLIAVPLMTLRETFPDGRLGMSLVVFAGAFLGLPPALGPLLGGLLLDNQLSWRWMFIIDAVLAGAAFALCARVLPERAAVTPRPTLDWVGGVLLATALVPLQYVLYEGERLDWWSDGWIAALTLVVVLALVVFVAWERRTSQPLVDFGFLAEHKSLALAIVLVLPIAVCLAATVATILEFVQRFLGYTATLAGALTLVRVFTYIPLVALVGILFDRRRLNVRAPLAAGLLLLAGASAMQASATTTDSGFWLIEAALIAGGLAIGPAVVPLLWSVFRPLPRLASETLRAATLVGISLQLGAVFAPTLIAVTIDRRFAFHYEVLRAAATARRVPLLALATTRNPVAVFTQVLTQQSYALAFADAALLCGLLAALVFPAALFLRPRAR